jgi:hypothetical protein
MELYAPDGVFMPQHSPSSEGTEAVKKAYDFVFEMLTLAVKFKVQCSPSSACTMTDLMCTCLSGNALWTHPSLLAWIIVLFCLSIHARSRRGCLVEQPKS